MLLDIYRGFGQKHFSPFYDRFEAARVLTRDSPQLLSISAIIKLWTLRACSVRETPRAG